MAGFIIYIYISTWHTPLYTIDPMSKISSHDMYTKLHGCPFYQAGISSLWGSDLSLLQRLWYFAPRKAEQVSNRLRGKPEKMSTYLNMNIIWLEKQICTYMNYALILNCLEKCQLSLESLAQMPGKNIRAYVSNVAAAHVSSRQIKSDMFPDGMNTSSRENDGNIFCLSANQI